MEDNISSAGGAIEDALDIWHARDYDDIDFILLLPHECERFNTYIKSEFCKKLRGRSGAVVYGREASILITLYSLYAFTDKIIVGSLELPHGRKLRNLLDTGIATREEIISEVILSPLQ